MITVLVVGPPRSPLPAAAAGNPSVEVLAAGSAEEALEKLARNRRIDAVLLLPGSEAAELAAALAEEDPSAPPLFAPQAAGAIPGVISLPDADSARLLEQLVGRLEPKG